MSVRTLRSRTLALAAVVTLGALSASTHASTFTADFESGSFDLFPGASLSTEQSHSITHSIKYDLADASDQTAVRVAPGAIPLKNISGSFWAYVTGTSTLAPYMYLGVDSDNDGNWNAATDSLVLAFSGGPIPSSFSNDTWFQSGLDSSTKVHVVNNRPGLTPGTYDSAGTQDTLAHLSDQIAFGSTKWGDLNVLRAYIGAGAWPGATNYVAYADDLTITSASPVPLPSASVAGLTLLGLTAAATGLRRRTNPAR